MGGVFQVSQVSMNLSLKPLSLTDLTFDLDHAQETLEIDVMQSSALFHLLANSDFGLLSVV